MIMHEPEFTIPSSFLDYLDDLALPACIFPHSTLLASSTTLEALLPIYQNPALKSLLSEGTKKGASAKHSSRSSNGGGGANGHGDANGNNGNSSGSEVEDAHKVKAYLRDALEEDTRNELVDWLIDGVRTTMQAKNSNPKKYAHELTTASAAADKRYLAPTSSAFSPSRPKIHRDRSLQLSTDVAFAKLYWRASHNGYENDGFTVLTQLPIGHFAVRSSWDDKATPKTPVARPLRRARLGPEKHGLAPGKIMIGAHEVDAEKARDPNSLEGMAYTLFHAPIGLFRVNSDLSITMANPSWRNTCGASPFLVFPPFLTHDAVTHANHRL